MDEAYKVFVETVHYTDCIDVIALERTIKNIKDKAIRESLYTKGLKKAHIHCISK